MIDYHAHSDCSGDCQAPMIDVCEAAVAAGITEICFTDHLDFDPTDTCYRRFDYDAYRVGIDAARERFGSALKIRSGLEVDYQPAFASQIESFLAGKEFDCIVGAAHYVDGIILERHEEYFSGKSPSEAYEPYFERVMQVVETGWFDTLAHIDLCKRYGVRYFGRFVASDYAKQIDAILRRVVETDMTLEVNTSGSRQSPRESYPAHETLRRYKAIGGKNITVGSDCHAAGDVGTGISDALELAEAVGIDSVDTFEARRRIKLPIRVTSGAGREQ